MPTIKQPVTVELALLGFVREQPIHPYEMHQRLLQRKALGFIWQLKQSHLYALLARLEADGYLVHTLESQGSRPPRKLLQITPEGRAAFAQ
jgi:DNA-binding PadR family transcriptional regulator